MACTLAQRRRSQRPRGGRQGTGYDAPLEDSYDAPVDAQPAYGADQDVYQVQKRLKHTRV